MDSYYRPVKARIRFTIELMGYLLNTSDIMLNENL